MADKRIDIEIGVRKEGRGDEEAREGLRDLSAAAGEAQEQLDNLQTPSLDGIGEAAKAEAEKVADAAAALAASGEEANKAGVNFGSLSKTLSGLNQIKSDDVITQFKGLGSVLQNVASLGVGVLGPGSAFVGVIAAAAGAIGLIAASWEKESPEVLAEMERLRTGAEEVKKDLNDLSDVKPNFESVIASIKEVQEAYAEMQEEADKALQMQKRQAEAQNKLRKASLTLEREKTVAAVPEEAQPAVRAAFAEKERQFDYSINLDKIGRELEAKEQELANKIAERTAIQERLRLYDEEVARRAALLEAPQKSGIDRARSMSPGGSAVEPQATARDILRSLLQSQESTRAKVSNEVKPKLKPVDDKIAEIENEIASLNTELLALQTSVRAVDITALPKTAAAIASLRPFLDEAGAAVEAARQSGDNLNLQAALKSFQDLSRVMEELQSIGGRMSETGSSFDGAGGQLQRALDGMAEAAQTLNELSRGIGIGADSVNDAATDAAAKLEDTSRALESGAQTLNDAAADAAAALVPALDPVAGAIRESAANLEQNLSGALDAPAAALESGAQAITDAAADAAAALVPALDPVAGAIREGAANLEQNLSGALDAPAAALESGAQSITDAAANAGVSVRTEGAAAADALRTAGSEIGASVGALGAEAKKGATEAAAKIEEIGTRLATDLQTGAQRIDGDAAAFQDRVGQSIQGMATSVDSMGREVVRGFDEITARLNAIAAQSRNALQLADLALQQVLNS